MTQPMRSNVAIGATMEAQVAMAKRLMRDGWTMKEAARTLGVLPSELDLALWKHIGVDPDDLSVRPVVRHEPMF
jgi:hypothetical protein